MRNAGFGREKGTMSKERKEINCLKGVGDYQPINFPTFFGLRTLRFGVADVRKIRRPQAFFPARRGRKVFSFSWFPFLGGGEGKRIIPPNGGKYA